MTISLFEAHGLAFELSSEKEIANISAPRPLIQKLRTLSFLQLLKIEKGKWPYFFYLWPRSRDIGNFFL